MEAADIAFASAAILAGFAVALLSLKEERDEDNDDDEFDPSELVDRLRSTPTTTARQWRPTCAQP